MEATWIHPIYIWLALILVSFIKIDWDIDDVLFLLISLTWRNSLTLDWLFYRYLILISNVLLWTNMARTLLYQLVLEPLSCLLYDLTLQIFIFSALFYDLSLMLTFAVWLVYIGTGWVYHWILNICWRLTNVGLKIILAWIHWHWRCHLRCIFKLWLIETQMCCLLLATHIV